MPLSVTVLEVPARFADMEYQLRWIDDELSKRAADDVLVLPEASLTGYVSRVGDFDLSQFAEPLEGRQLAALKALAARTGAVVVGPVIERFNAKCFNTMAVVSPTGQLLAHYRKRHPWFPEAWATAGQEQLPQFELNDYRCTLAICFDVHFVSAESSAVLAACDVLFFPSAWVDEDGDARPALLGSLSRDFGLNIINSNWGPGEPAIFGQGGSLFVDPTGAISHRASTHSTRLDGTIASRKKR